MKHLVHALLSTVILVFTVTRANAQQCCTGNVSTYCTTGTSVQGCVPSISGAGQPSISAGSGFDIAVGSLPGQRYGTIFYGFYSFITPWAPGSPSFKCVANPVQRMGNLHSGGTLGQCNGELRIDFNAWITANPTALGSPFAQGQTIRAQAWYRDPAAPAQTNLSNALAFTLCNGPADTTPPVITTCAAPLTIVASPSTCAVLVPDLRSHVVATDNCSGVTVSQVPAPGSTVGIGTLPIVLRVRDASGNAVTCAAVLTVEDGTPPTIIQCAPDQNVLAVAGCSAAVPDFTGSVVATDCDPAVTLTQSPAAGTTVGVGSTMVTLTASDSAGNSAVCMASVNVLPSPQCPAELDLTQVSNGFGLILPHRVIELDSQGSPTAAILEIRTAEQLKFHVRQSNPVLPVATWPVTASLPGGLAGNHFIYAEFSNPIDIATVLDPSPAGAANSGLIGPITVLAVDPSTGQSTPVVGRAFVGGRTYAGVPAGSAATLQLQMWVVPGAGGLPMANNSVDNNADGVPDGLGFPGTQSTPAFPGAASLVSDRTFVFVPDADGDLRTHERFPTNRQIRLRATTAVASIYGRQLIRQVVASSTVGVDLVRPEVAVTPPPNSIPLTSPSFGDVDVDPLTKILVEFTEPIQPTSVGSFPNVIPPVVSPAITITFGPSNQQTQVPYTCLPLSVYDLSKWELTPTFNFPGNGPASQACGLFNRVSLTFVQGQIRDLASNTNALGAYSDFTTGEGTGLVNAPVAPDVVYVGRSGTTPGISVIDLNGFGQSTGDPQFDFSYQTFPKGWSNFPNNPNLIHYGPTMYPPLFPGSCTADGGSAGAFTLTKDTSLSDRLVRPPLIMSVGEMALGHSLDTVYHNGSDSTGCRFGGGNICAINGAKVIRTSFQTSQTLGPPLSNQTPAAIVPGGPNPVSFAPHPNPPPLRFPPLCLQPFIGGEEPTSIFTATASPTGLGFTNLLVSGNPLRQFALPPSGIAAQFQNSFFVGPDRSPLSGSGPCLDHQYRQQIGHFLYVLDRVRNEVVVLNSNRMTVIDRIPVADPTDIAMAPNLDFIAISNQNADTVTFIDIDPVSSTFHQIVRVTTVGDGPTGLCWDPGNEDILVCNELGGSVSVISAFTLDVRKTVTSNLSAPFDIAILQRQIGFGYNRAVYFAWILNRNGDLTIFESGPSSVNGWGYDDTIGKAPFVFVNPKKVLMNYEFLGGSVWVLHENPLDLNGVPTGQVGGAVTRVDIDSGAFGVLPLSPGPVQPQFRNMALKVRVSIGPGQLTGIPVDIALDELNNLGAAPNNQSNFGSGTPISMNGKSVVRQGGQPTIFPDYMFLAVPTSSEGPGVIDVIALTSNYTRFDTDKYLPGTQSIPCSGARTLGTYFKQ
jgi:hypothetical protein